MAEQTPGRAKSGRRGSVALEYGLIAPLLLVLVLGIIDTGRLIWIYTTLYRATEAAARCGAVNTTVCATAPQIQTYAVAEAWGMTVDPSVFTVTAPSCGLQVRAAYNFTSIVPGFGKVAPKGLITLQATACYPL
jgi:Flp pilus assembly protein TadG